MICCLKISPSNKAGRLLKILEAESIDQKRQKQAKLLLEKMDQDLLEHMYQPGHCGHAHEFLCEQRSEGGPFCLECGNHHYWREFELINDTVYH